MKNKKFRGISLLMAMIMAFTIYLPLKYVRADIIETTIPTGSGPWSVAVNSNTNKIYVLNKNDNNIEIIDGDNLNNKCFVNISKATAVAVNPETNKIYVTSLGNRLTVIDGTTKNITNIIPVGETPCSIAVDEIRNIIYVANHFGNNVTIIDGNTNKFIATVPVGTCPNGIEVNPNTNKIYVANQDSGNVTVIDGDTKSTTNVNTGAQPSSIAVNLVTNKIYVANGSGCGVTIIDGATNSINNINVGGYTTAVAVNSGNNKIYLSDGSYGQLDIIDGGTYEITKVPVGNSPYGIALNTQTQNIYVNNYEDNTLTILDGHTYNVAYDANGGTGNGTSDTYNYNVSDGVTVKANTFINDGYYFTGWNTSINGTGTGYSPGSNFNISSNVKLYAQWKPVPKITGVSSVAVPANGTYSIGDTLNFTVNYDQNVTVTGTPELSLTIGSSIETASYVSGSETNALVFSYTVQPGDKDSDGIALGSSIVLRGGTIKGVEDSNAGLTLNSIGSTAGILVDGVVPAFDPASGTTLSSDNKTVTLSFSKPVINALPDGTALKNAVTLAADGINFNELGANDNVVITDGKVVITLASPITGTASKIRISGESLKDTAGNIKTQSIVTDSICENVIPAYTVTYDGNGNDWGAVPLDKSMYSKNSLVTVAIEENIGKINYAFTGWNTATDGKGTSYSSGSSFNILKNTTLYAQWKPVPNITSVSPAKGLFLGGTNVVITGTGFTGATSVKFGSANATSFTVDSDSRITVQAPPYGDYWVSCFITVTTAYGTGSDQFEYFPPTLVSSVSLPNNGIYKIGDNLDFIVNYDYPVAVTGTPLLAITIGSAKKTASYAGGNCTNKLKFTYTVQPGDCDNDGIELYNTIELNGGTIKGVGGFDAGLTLKNAGSTKGILITNKSIGMSNGDSITAQIPVTRRTDANGTVNDSVQIGQAAIESAAGASAGTLTVNDPSNNFSVTVLDAAVHSLADRNASIAFGTPLGSVKISPGAMAGFLASGITIQFGEVTDTLALRATTAAIGQYAPGATQLSTPCSIETNYRGRTQVTIPINPSVLPTSQAEMKKFLSNLAVMVQHSDGENVVQKGEIKYDQKGSPIGAAIWVDKFSTFTLVELADTTSETGSANTTGTANSVSNSTSGSKTLVQTGAVIDYKLQIASGLIIVLLGVILVIAGKKREDL